MPTTLDEPHRRSAGGRTAGAGPDPRRRQGSLASIKRALTALAEEPHPDQAVAWGGSGIYRLHLPGIRILYQVDEDTATVYVVNVAATTR